MTQQFETGATYYARSICNDSCIFRMKVIKRTPKTLLVDVENFGQKRLKLKNLHGAEMVEPLGSYSMSPIMTPDKKVAA